MLKRLNQKGFSLVELMVVVAIIGILASIAIPQFQKFTAKAKQSEAKTNLGALAKSQGAWKAEFLGYTNCFGIMNFSPEGNLTYNIGFNETLGQPAWGGSPATTAANCYVTAEYKTAKNLNIAATITRDAAGLGLNNVATRIYCNGLTGSATCRMKNGTDGRLAPLLSDTALPSAGGVGAASGTLNVGFNAATSEAFFVAGAAGAIYKRNIDVWSIDDNGRLTNGSDGLQ